MLRILIAILLLVSADAANAETRILVGSSAGSASDIVARLIAQWLGERSGEPFIVENRPGAGGSIATEAAVQAPPDGRTLLLLAPSQAINATLDPKPGVSLARDIVPVAGLTNQANLMLVHPSVPARNVAEFIAYARAHPRAISFASSGKGTSLHLAAEMLASMANIEMVHVPYRGGNAAAIDLIAGRVQLWFGVMSTAAEALAGGKLRLLAVTTATRWRGLPDIPTVAETLPGYAMSTWFGLGAPRGTPKAVIDRLNRAIDAGLTDPRMRARFADLGCEPMPGSSDDFGRMIAADIGKWASVIDAAGIVARHKGVEERPSSRARDGRERPYAAE